MCIAQSLKVNSPRDPWVVLIYPHDSAEEPFQTRCYKIGRHMWKICLCSLWNFNYSLLQFQKSRLEIFLMIRNLTNIWTSEVQCFATLFTVPPLWPRSLSCLNQTKKKYTIYTYCMPVKLLKNGNFPALIDLIKHLISLQLNRKFIHALSL
jgi:hypothetical protein